MHEEEYITQWLQTFPEAEKEYVLPKIRAVEAEIQQLEGRIRKRLKGTQTKEDGWFVRECIKASHMGHLVELKREYYRLRRYLPQKVSSGHVNRDLIDRAKQCPIVQFAEEHLQDVRRSGKAYRTLCPFHRERTPSFYLYPGGNSFHCFGCQAHGDVIALAQKLLNIGFVEAVKHLTNAYV